MNNRAIFSMIVLMLSVSISFSQTNNRIKRESDSNRNNRERDHNSNGDSSTEGCDPSGCVDGCSALFQVGGAVVDGLAKADENIKAKEIEVPRINSVEIGFNSGFVSPNSTLLLPSFRLRRGLLSTHFRVFSNTEQNIEGNNSYITLNWQILQFNLAVEKTVNITIGSGILYENYSGLTFNEFGLYLEFFPSDKFYIPIEVRYTPDYRTGKTVLFETHTGIGYTFKKWKNSALRFNLNYTFGKYYEAVNVNCFSAGLSFLLDTGKSTNKIK